MSTDVVLGEERGASLSPDGLYRYRLTRRWDDEGQMAVWVMLNPSTADALVDDPTIRRVRGFTKGWGYAGFTVVNLYAYRSTDPKGLRDAAEAGVDPVGPDNDRVIRGAVEGARLVVAAWGALRPWMATRVVRLLQGPLADANLYCLGPRTKSHHPRHPLYLPGDTELVRWQ